jgi:hypothetical protein
MEDRFFHKDLGQRNPGTPCAKRFCYMTPLPVGYAIIIKTCLKASKILFLRGGQFESTDTGKYVRIFITSSLM